MPNHLLGRSLSGATAISSNQPIRNRVSASNRIDLFSFKLNSPHRLNLKFRSTGRGIEINLIRDQNQNGIIDNNEILKRTKIRSRNNNLINVPNAVAGTYFVQVGKTGSGASNYRFNLTTTPSIPTGSTTSISSPATVSVASIINQIVSLTNNFRQQNGLAPVTLNSRLSRAAQTHSENMAFQDFVSHTGVDGSSVAQRVTATGYGWSVVAENIAAGYQTATEVVQGWINSNGHRANLLNPDVTEIGIGYYFLASDSGNENWNYYWTQVFGAPV
ncbi:MAG: CAP domain-containing protein [Leptolyngbya sp. IPPAS B-1204]|uniref:CAP domain-containing protein n=1 Tax=Leptolyngbya sp. NK1-12 TaxID=2547451 RepID=A0AA97AIY6_9CYAN|nr:CAP domain-containing protein [Leptolyngbya sp. NK1-12]MBF2049408.1 CAP domain-containing protein [Elainella sp. C42_A2020_010]RNJ68428.1 MAG: CAP domain-containing protein [Leptolyngbya sp. IPPAS B-1204]WNZ24331.1 CAP domain-containing protein [Leptolyngbya sp. NK1-12]